MRAKQGHQQRTVTNKVLLAKSVGFVVGGFAGHHKKPSGRPAQRHLVTGDQNGERLHKEPQLYHSGSVKGDGRLSQLGVAETGQVNRQVRGEDDWCADPSGPHGREH